MEEKGLLDKAGDFTKNYHVTKIRIQVRHIGVHPDNRGGVYPNGARVEGLAKQILSVGFKKEIADHMGVCVQDWPGKDVPNNHTSFHEYNIAKSQLDDKLKRCFEGPLQQCLYGALSHNHLILVLKAILNQADFDWPESWKPALTRKGGIDLEDIKVRSPDLFEVLTNGIQMTVLRPEIMTEKSEACSLISQALNKESALACETAETTAMAVLAKRISYVQKANSPMQGNAAFEEMKVKLRAELDSFVDHEHFIDMYSFVQDLGAAEGPHLQWLLKFFQVTIDSTKRRLPLAAFAEINKLPPKTPRVHVAVCVYSYLGQKSSTTIWCPMPDPVWAKASLKDIQDLEQLFRYFDVDLSPVLDKLEEVEKIHFQMNVYNHVARSYITRKKEDPVRKAILQGVA